jgi:2-polyprenyl-6-hydroxyphenyl methylase/3-demethylubiquinone-9 3-methyltransferase
MDQSLAVRLTALARLDRANAAATAMPCKVCGRPAPFFDLVDFNKCGSSGYGFGPSGIAVPYHRCTACGFMFTAFCDDWSANDFHRFIYNDDYWQVDVEHRSTRPRRIADQMLRVLAPFKECRILDYGSGEGLFVQYMREAGFSNIFAYDPFLMAQRPEGRFDLITCFEVLEHTPSPAQTIADMRSLLLDGGCMLVSQALQPPDIERMLCSWWYCAPRNGHISLFADRTMALLAEHAGLIFHRGGMPHVFRDPGNDRFAELASALAPEFQAVTLSPPRDPGPGWHNPEEGRGTGFRWSAADRLAWRLPSAHSNARVVQVRIPFLMQARPGFASECEIAIGGRSAAVHLREGAIFGELDDIPLTDVDLVLHTPSLPTPAELGDSPDRRKLGLALPMES